MIQLDIEIEYSTRGPSNIMKYNLNKKEMNLNKFHSGFFLSNDYYNGMNRHDNDFDDELLKNWSSYLL